MPKKTTWIVVADGTRARILTLSREGRRLELVREMASEAARRKSSDLVADRQGRAFDSGAHGQRSAMEPRTDPQRHEQAAFAAELAAVLNEAAQAQRFDVLHLIAAPKALGDLRAQLSPEAQGRVVKEIDKNLTPLALPQLEEHLAAELWP